MADSLKKPEMKPNFTIPKPVLYCADQLVKAGFKAYLIGGCVRDILINRSPKDWDIATDATPEQIIALYPKTFYENVYGTVGVVTEEFPVEFRPEQGSATQNQAVIEVTPFRMEAKYSDNRRPDAVTFSKNISDDVKRRDFTINAIGLEIGRGGAVGEVYDEFGGREDLKKSLIKAVGNADERFKEDALRTMRAIRIACELQFDLDSDTKKAVQSDSHLLANISQERIRDEFSRILMSPSPMHGLKLAHELGILKVILPELEATVGVEQNQAHSYDVWEHLLRTVQHSADKNFPLETRLAALFHDISKPESRRFSKESNQWTFYGHEVIGARVTEKILTRLKYPTAVVQTVTRYVRWHMFFSDTEQITLSAVRRMVANVGKEHIWSLMNVRICDRIGTGRPKESPYRLRKYHSMIEEALRDPISVGMLKIDGKGIMDACAITPGPKIGLTLHALLEEVLEDPLKNTEEYLKKRSIELVQLPENELKALGEAGKEKKAEADAELVEEIRKKHHVA